jgi:hypothetical protein
MCLSQHVEDVREKRGVSRFVSRERIEQFPRPDHGKWGD